MGSYTRLQDGTFITEIIIATVLLLVFMLVAIRGASVSGSLQYYFCVAMVIVVLLMFSVRSLEIILHLRIYNH